MEKTMKMRPPLMPNFIQSMDGSFTLDISELSEKEAKEYSELMKISFINHWRKRKNSKR